MQERTYDDVPVERLLNEDWKEKQSAGKGAYSRQSGRRSNGRMPYETLKGKALEEYMGNSEVTAYKLEGFEQIKKERLLEGFAKVPNKPPVKKEYDVKIKKNGYAITFGRSIISIFEPGQKVDVLNNGSVFAIVLSENGEYKLNSFNGSVAISSKHLVSVLIEKTGVPAGGILTGWIDGGVFFLKNPKGK